MLFTLPQLEQWNDYCFGYFLSKAHILVIANICSDDSIIYNIIQLLTLLFTNVFSNVIALTLLIFSVRMMAV